MESVRTSNYCQARATNFPWDEDTHIGVDNFYFFIVLFCLRFLYVRFWFFWLLRGFYCFLFVSCQKFRVFPFLFVLSTGLMPRSSQHVVPLHCRPAQMLVHCNRPPPDFRLPGLSQTSKILWTASLLFTTWSYGPKALLLYLMMVFAVYISCVRL